MYATHIVHINCTHVHVHVYMFSTDLQWIYIIIIMSISFHFISFIISHGRNNHKHNGKEQIEKNMKYMYMMKSR